MTTRGDKILKFRSRQEMDRSISFQVCGYQQAAIHESVGVGQLVKALTSHGLTISNLPGLGIVIHPVGQDPCLPWRR